MEQWRRNPAYWGAAGAGVLPMAEDTGRFLVPLRSHRVYEPLTWSTIGGKLDTTPESTEPYYDDEEGEWIEPDPEDAELENPEDAVYREFEEETGYSLPMELIDLYVFEDPEVGFTYYNFLGIIPFEFEPHITWETERWAWLTFDELLAIEPKHFGLAALLEDEDSIETIQEYLDE